MMEYSEENVFATLDPGNLGFLEIKTIDSFFKRTFTKNICLEDNAAIIRRLDLDGDNKLKFDEFIAGIRAQQPYSKMLIRNAMKQEDAFKKEEEEQKKKKKVMDAKKAKDPEAVKVHNELMANRFNQIQKFDKDWPEVPGVSPIRCRHEVDLYGVKSGLGKFNPIMVENVNKILEPEDYEDNKGKGAQAKSAKKEKKDDKAGGKSAKKEAPAPPKEKEKKTPSKLVLTNKREKTGPDYSQFSLPATFKSKYAEYRVAEQSPNKPVNRNLAADFGASPIPVNKDLGYDLGSSINDRSQQPFGNLNAAASVNFSPSPHENRRSGVQQMAPQSPISPAYQPSYTVIDEQSAGRMPSQMSNNRPKKIYEYEPPVFTPTQLQPIDRQLPPVNNYTQDLGQQFPRNTYQNDPQPDWMNSYQSQNQNENMGSAISSQNRDILERGKIGLAQRQDFNLIDAFRIFDTHGDGQITS